MGCKALIRYLRAPPPRGEQAVSVGALMLATPATTAVMPIQGHPVTELLIACIGATVVIITTGYAFGTVRRRRAIKELLEIRNALDANDLSRREKVERMLDGELDALEDLLNTTQRWLKARLYSVGVLLAIAIGMFSIQGLVPDGGARHATKYVAAGACALATLLLYGLADQGLQRIRRRRWRILSSFAVPSAILLVGVLVAVTLLHGTPYYQDVLQR